MGVDYGFMWSQIISLILGKLYLWIGAAAMLLLIPLAITSFNYFQRTMGKWWKWLHWLVYPAAVLAILHYALAQKGDIFLLRGNIVKPFLLLALTALMLVLRIPPIRRWIRMNRRQLFDRIKTFSPKNNRKREEEKLSHP